MRVHTTCLKYVGGIGLSVGSLRVGDIRIHDEFNQATSHTPDSQRIDSKYETVPG